VGFAELSDLYLGTWADMTGLARDTGLSQAQALGLAWAGLGWRGLAWLGEPETPA
jgi:hypothetical protein